MKHIHISPGVQVVAVVGTVAAVGAAVAAQMPEIQRYLKIRSM